MNSDSIELFRNYNYRTNPDEIRHLAHTILQFVETTEYLFIYHTTLTILVCKVNEIINKNNI